MKKFKTGGMIFVFSMIIAMCVGCPQKPKAPPQEKPNSGQDVPQKQATDTETVKQAAQGKPAQPQKPVLAAQEDVDVALKRLEQLGGTFTKAPNGAVTSIAIEYEDKLTPDDFGLFAKLLDLESVTFFGPQVTDEGFLQLSPLKNLKTIRLANTTITNASFEMIRDNMPELTQLYANRIELGNDGLAIIAQMKKVSRLEILSNNIDMFGLKSLGQIEGLKVLDLRGCTSLTSLTYLASVKNLEVLKLRNPISNRGIKTLLKCENLRALDLQDIEQITDDSAEDLANIAKLQDLSLFRMKYTDEVLKKLEGKGLERLTLREVPALTDTGIASLKTMPKLNRLNLSELNNITDARLKDILQGNTTIRNLVLWSMPKLGDETGEALGTMTELRSLEIRGIGNMTDKTIDAVAKLPKLETLTVGDCGYSLDDLEKLTNLKTLKSLTIYGDKAKVEKIIAKLQPEMPKCKMSFKAIGLH